jgi:hypothetical protein
MSSQKQKVEKLLSIEIDLDNFYAIRIYDAKIQLQGEARKSTISECEAAGYVFQYENHYLEAKKDGIEITLTF